MNCGKVRGLSLDKNVYCGRKRSKLIIFSMAVILLFSGCGTDPLETVHTVFDAQEEMIRERIADTGENDKDKWKDLTGVIEVDDEYEDAIQFICISEGIVSSGFEAGFYYSPEDKPTCVGWLSGPLSKDGNGYSYSEDGTDNSYYTEKMCENFYYYQVRN